MAAQQQTFPISFTCTNCGCDNTYQVTLLVGTTEQGTKEQLFRCKKCNFDNLITLGDGHRFPEKTPITRGE